MTREAFEALGVVALLAFASFAVGMGAGLISLMLF